MGRDNTVGLEYDDGWVLTLQDLEVLYVGIFGVDVELDAGHGNICKDTVEYLTKSGSVSLPPLLLALVPFIRSFGRPAG